MSYAKQVEPSLTQLVVAWVSHRLFVRRAPSGRRAGDIAATVAISGSPTGA
jgi:hypothetical protein